MPLQTPAKQQYLVLYIAEESGSHHKNKATLLISPELNKRRLISDCIRSTSESVLDVSFSWTVNGNFLSRLRSSDTNIRINFWATRSREDISTGYTLIPLKSAQFMSCNKKIFWHRLPVHINQPTSKYCLLPKEIVVTLLIQSEPPSNSFDQIFEADQESYRFQGSPDVVHESSISSTTQETSPDTSESGECGLFWRTEGSRTSLDLYARGSSCSSATCTTVETSLENCSPPDSAPAQLPPAQSSVQTTAGSSQDKSSGPDIDSEASFEFSSEFVRQYKLKEVKENLKEVLEPKLKKFQQTLQEKIAEHKRRDHEKRRRDHEKQNGSAILKKTAAKKLAEVTHVEKKGNPNTPENTIRPVEPTKEKIKLPYFPATKKEKSNKTIKMITTPQTIHSDSTTEQDTESPDDNYLYNQKKQDRPKPSRVEHQSRNRVKSQPRKLCLTPTKSVITLNKSEVFSTHYIQKKQNSPDNSSSEIKTECSFVSSDTNKDNEDAKKHLSESSEIKTELSYSGCGEPNERLSEEEDPYGEDTFTEVTSTEEEISDEEGTSSQDEVSNEEKQTVTEVATSEEEVIQPTTPGYSKSERKNATRKFSKPFIPPKPLTGTFTVPQSEKTSNRTSASISSLKTDNVLERKISALTMTTLGEQDCTPTFHQYLLNVKVTSIDWNIVFGDIKVSVGFYDPLNKNIITVIKNENLGVIDVFLACIRFYTLYICLTNHILETIQSFPPKIAIRKADSNRLVAKGSLNIQELEKCPKHNRFRCQIPLIGKHQTVIGKIFVMITLQDLGAISRRHNKQPIQCFLKFKKPPDEIISVINNANKPQANKEFDRVQVQTRTEAAKVNSNQTCKAPQMKDECTQVYTLQNKPKLSRVSSMPEIQHDPRAKNVIRCPYRGCQEHGFEYSIWPNILSPGDIYSFINNLENQCPTNNTFINAEQYDHLSAAQYNLALLLKHAELEADLQKKCFMTVQNLENVTQNIIREDYPSCSNENKSLSLPSQGSLADQIRKEMEDISGKLNVYFNERERLLRINPCLSEDSIILYITHAINHLLKDWFDLKIKLANLPKC